MSIIFDKEIIAKLGGQSQLVHRCTVYQWTKRGIPRPWKLYLQRLHPALFKDKTNPLIDA
jgi:hypothetical protein